MARKPPQTATFATKTAARDWARAVEQSIAAGRNAATDTLGALIDRYSEEIGRLRPFGRSKAGAIAKLKAGIGHRRVDRLAAQDIIEHAHVRRAEGAGPVTVNVELSYLGTILRTARALWRLQVSDECVREARQGLAMVGLVGRSRARDRRPTTAEIAALCAYWRANPRQSIPAADLVEFAIASAMRLGEIAGLRWTDLDAAARVITIRDRKHPRQKLGNDERVPLLTVAGYDALAIIERQPHAAERIFPVRPASMSRAFDRACKELRISGLTFHDLRHEGVSRLFEAGLPIEHVALISGHRDWRTLRRYTQLKPESVIARLALLTP